MLEEGIEISHDGTIFFEWQSKILKLLRLKGVQDDITGDIHNSCKDEKAALLIIENVSPRFKRNLQSCKTAKEMMLRLESHFAYKKIFEKLHIKKQLFNLSSEPFENLQSHFHKFDALISKLKALNCEMGEIDQVFHLLFTLLDRYDCLISYLYKSFGNAFWEDTLTLDCIKITLLDYEAALLAQMCIENDGNSSFIDCEEKNVLKLCGDLTQQLHDKKHTSKEAGQFSRQISNDNSGLEHLQNNYDTCTKDQLEQYSDIISNETVNVRPEQINNENIDDCSSDVREMEDEGSREIFDAEVCKTEHESMCVLKESEIVCQRVLDSQFLLRDIDKDLHCLECNKWFLTPMQLTQHKITHSISLTLPYSVPPNHSNDFNHRKKLRRNTPKKKKLPTNAYHDSSQAISLLPPSGLQTVPAKDVSISDLESIPPPSDSIYIITPVLSTKDQITSSSEESVVFFDEEANLDEDVLDNDSTETLIFYDEEKVDKMAASDLVNENDDDQNDHTKLNSCDSVMELNDNTLKEPYPFETVLLIDNNTEEIILDPVKNELESQCVLEAAEINCRKDFFCELKLRDIAYDLLCSFCNKWFLTTQELKMHKLTHLRSQNCLPSITRSPKSSYSYSISSSISKRVPFGLDSSKDGLTSSLNITDVPTDTDFEFESNAKNQSAPKTESKQNSDSPHNDAKLLDCNVFNCTTDRPCYCHICRKPFDRKDLDKHLRTHEGIRVDGQELSAEVSTIEITDSLPVHTTFNAFNENEIVNNRGVCDICGRPFQSRFHSQMLIHRESHTGFKSHACDQCGKCFVHKSTLNAHIRDLHTLEKPLNRKDLKRHYNTHNGTIERPYYCHVCRKPFSRKDLDKHLKTHDDISIDGQEHCAEATATEITDSLPVHTTFNVEETRGVCDICGRSFGSRSHSQMLIHRDTHTGFKSHACDLCGKCFSDKRTLNTHIQHKHSLEKPVYLHICEVCGKKFAVNRVYLEHKRNHSRVYPEKKSCICKFCGKIVSHATLRSHCHKHNPNSNKVIECATCGYKTVKKSDLSKHMSKHMTDKPFKCDVCKKRFKLNEYLDRHKLTHAKDGQKYSCSVCGRRFFHNKSLARHMRTPHSDRTSRFKVMLKE